MRDLCELIEPSQSLGLRNPFLTDRTEFIIKLAYSNLLHSSPSALGIVKHLTMFSQLRDARH